MSRQHIQRRLIHLQKFSDLSFINMMYYMNMNSILLCVSENKWKVDTLAMERTETLII